MSLRGFCWNEFCNNSRFFEISFAKSCLNEQNQTDVTWSITGQSFSIAINAIWNHWAQVSYQVYRSFFFPNSTNSGCSGLLLMIQIFTNSTKSVTVSNFNKMTKQDVLGTFEIRRMTARNQKGTEVNFITKNYQNLDIVVFEQHFLNGVENPGNRYSKLKCSLTLNHLLTFNLENFLLKDVSRWFLSATFV